MKTLFAFLAAFSLCAMNLTVRADDDKDKHDEESHQEFDAKVQLLPTDNAPANAFGKAKIESEEDDGEAFGEVEVEVKGLPAGDYTVSLVRFSDSSSVTLGTLTVGAEDEDENEDEDGDSGDENEQDHLKSSDNNNGDDGDNGGEGETDFDLPLEVDPSDISQIIVSDSNGTALLIGDLQAGATAKINFRAKAKLKAGDAAPDVKGDASIRVKVKKGKHSEKFKLNGKKFPGSTSLTVRADGDDVSQASTSRRGKLLIKKLQVPSLTDVRTVELVDEQSTVLGTANFKSH